MITYDEIYNRMKSEFSAKSKYDFDEASDAAIRMRVLAGEIFNAMTNIEWLKNQMFVATASGEYLDYFASQRGIERKQAQKAQGEITFFINEPVENSIFIPKGSMVLLQGRNNDPGAINKFESLKDFKSHYPLKRILYAGSIDLTAANADYESFMIIGIK